jgi:acyl dehydratase
MPEPRVFNGVDSVKAAVGEHLGYSEWLEITQERVNTFAEATGDFQWIHIDVERAKKESPFGGPIAHGFLTLSLLPTLGAYPVELSGQSSATNYGAEGLRFIAPVPVGSKLHARGRLVKAEAKPKGTLITTEMEVGVVGSEKPAILYKMQVLYR